MFTPRELNTLNVLKESLVTLLYGRFAFLQGKEILSFTDKLVRSPETIEI